MPLEVLICLGSKKKYDVHVQVVTSIWEKKNRSLRTRYRRSRGFTHACKHSAALTLLTTASHDRPIHTPSSTSGPIALDAHHAASRLGPGCSLEPRCVHAPRTRPHARIHTGRAVDPPHTHHTIASTVLHAHNTACGDPCTGWEVKSDATTWSRVPRLDRRNPSTAPRPPPHLS